MWSATTDFLPEALDYRPGAACGRQRGLAGILGALMGDALGVPHEFKTGDQVPAARHLALRMPNSYPKSHPAIPYGTWSDDGSQLLCLLDVLQQANGSLDARQFAESLLLWLNTARHQAGGLVFDCGGQTRRALQCWQDNTPLVRDLAALGNGALMRVLPAALATDFWNVTETAALSAAMAQAAVTHPQPLSVVACGLYGALARRVPGGCPAGARQEPGAAAARIDWRAEVKLAAYQLRQHPEMTAEHQQALDTLLHFGDHELPTGAGYVANTFWSAIASLERANDYLGAVRNAIRLGNDTDTTACVTGGLAALAWGLDSVPASWWPELRMPAKSQALLATL